MLFADVALFKQDMSTSPLPPHAPAPDSPSVVDRMLGQGERVHIPLGQTCNNNCLFCMEGDREARRAVNAAMHPDRIRWILQEHAGAEEVCFTSGEPTLHPMLPDFVRWAAEYGFRRISLMTNGRRLSYAGYTRSLVQAGLNRVYVSVHGHNAMLHDSLTRTPGSFAQTFAGLQAVASHKRRGISLHTSTVIARRNVARLPEIYRFLSDTGVDQMVFNAVQVTGRAAQLVDIVVPRYPAVIESFQRLVEQAPDHGSRAFLVDVPLCVTQNLPDSNRGWFERHVHYEVPSGPCGPTQAPVVRAIRRIQTAELDGRFRVYGPPCTSCDYKRVCPGVFAAYVDRHGWEDFAPIRTPCPPKV